jgi:hypothetical protein
MERPAEGVHVKTQMIRTMVVVLGTAALAGCGERAAVRATAQAATPVASAAVTAPPPPVACPVPAVAAATPAPTPEPRQATLGAEGKLAVKRFVLASGVKNREPVDAGTRFKGGAQKVYAFVEVENRGGAPAEIVVEFDPPGGGIPHGDVTLAVGPAPRWRTWAYTRTAAMAGAWTAVVKNKKGDVLARAPFEVTL